MNKNNIKSAEERTIGVKDVFAQLVSRWYIVVIAVIAGLIISLFYTKVICTPMYRSTAKIYVVKQGDEQITQSDISISTYFTRDYVELISDRTVLDEVINDLDLNYSYGALKSCISISNPESTRILEVSVTTPSPRLSMRIAQSVCEVSQRKIVELLNVDMVNIISDAYMPTAPSSPNLSKNMSYAFGISILISCAVLLVLSVIDDKLKGADDVEKYLGITVLGVIPYSKGRSNKKKYGYGEQRPKNATTLKE